MKGWTADALPPRARAQALSQMGAEEAKSKRRQKYNAKPTVVDGEAFASKREAKRYQELQVMVRAGEIIDLELHPVFILIGANGEPLFGDNGRQLRYTADFRYIRASDAAVVVEDSKGFKVRDYPLRKAIMRSMGIEIVEV